MGRANLQVSLLQKRGPELDARRCNSIVNLCTPICSRLKCRHGIYKPLQGDWRRRVRQKDQEKRPVAWLLSAESALGMPFDAVDSVTSLVALRNTSLSLNLRDMMNC